MGRNRGRFINRETNYLYNGDRAITDTFMLDDGSIVYHIYNVTPGGAEHSHQVTDEYGRHIYARAIGSDHTWIEIDRPDYKLATRWLSSLTSEKLDKVLKVTDANTLRLIVQAVMSENSMVEENSHEKGFSL
ncbi:MAG: hypothetical protein IKL65_06130 [Bacilli bacterium]|nr:hypothetical protein [Bacilli bacterium]